MSRVLVLIPMYGKAEMTRTCIEMTLKNAGCDVDVLVVDDGSPEPFRYDSERMVAVLRLKENVGFTQAVNEGLLWAGDRYEYIHLLNNDTEPEPDFIRILLDFMDENPVVGIAGSVRILEGKTEHPIELFGADLVRGHQICVDADPAEKVIYTYWVPLCSALVRVEALRYVGLLDRRMKIWCSDNDLCLRMNFAGYNVALLPASKVKHKHAVTTDSVQKEGKWSVEADQRVLIEKMAGMQYAALMAKLPLDAERGTYGRINFEVYTK